MSFNQKVWDACRKIPRGKLATYKSIAEHFKHQGIPGGGERA